MPHVTHHHNKSHCSCLTKYLRIASSSHICNYLTKLVLPFLQKCLSSYLSHCLSNYLVKYLAVFCLRLREYRSNDER